MKIIIWQDSTPQKEIDRVVSVHLGMFLGVLPLGVLHKDHKSPASRGKENGLVAKHPNAHSGAQPSFIRIIGQSGSGKTTQGRPAVMSKYPRHTVLTIADFVKYYPAKNPTREAANGFCLRVLTAVLFKCIDAKTDIILDMTMLTKRYEEKLLRRLQKNNYDIKYFVMAVPKEQSDLFIAKRERETGRAVSRESAEFFNAALQPALEFLVHSVPNAECVIWSAFELQPVYHGKMAGVMPPFTAARSGVRELKYTCDELLKAKIKFLCAPNK
jgi:hypothetical protein